MENYVLRCCHNDEYVDIFSYSEIKLHLNRHDPKDQSRPLVALFYVETCSNNPHLLFWMGKAEEVSARDLTRATTALFFLDSGNGESPLFLSAWTWWLLEVVCPLLLPLRLLLLGAEESSRPTMRGEATPTTRLVLSCSRADAVFWVPSV